MDRRGTGVGMRVAYVVSGFLIASLPALAPNVVLAKPVHKAVPKATPRAQVAHPSTAVMAAYAAMPQGERRGIQADLALLGAYEGLASGDIDERTIAAVRGFQRRSNNRETGILDAPQREHLAAAAKTPAEAVGWRLVDDPITGARLGIPQKLAPRVATSRTGSRWSSAQGQIQIETFRLGEAALLALFDSEKKAFKRQIGFNMIKGDSFVISGTQSLKDFVVRADASGSELRGVTILYDQATAGIMKAVTAAIANSFAGFPDPNYRPPGMRRSVEYGSAIVVSSSGDLIAPAELTAECESIAVPGFGHAERVAADASGDLALIRLYGTRDLVAASFAGDKAPAGDLTLVGVADPLAQAGGAEVTRAAARLTLLGIEPAPRLGFSGAAAVDARGALSGMVDLKSTTVAGGGSANQSASLVPIAAIRAFLRAQGVTLAEPAGEHGIEESVMRVICVRK